MKIFKKTEANCNNDAICSRIKDYNNEIWELKLSLFNSEDKSLWKLARALNKDHQEVPLLKEVDTIAYSKEDKAIKSMPTRKSPGK